VTPISLLGAADPVGAAADEVAAAPEAD